jgi:hypothetical protein
MKLDWVRLTLRLGRFELIAFTALVVGAAAAGVGVAAWIDSIKPPPECIPAYNQFTEFSPSCQPALDAWYQAKGSVGGLISGLVVFLPLAAGLFLGVPIVARELERGTTRLAWSLSPSRLRWFLARLIPILVILAVITFAAGVAADRLLAANEPGLDVANAFAQFGFRGVLLAGRAVFIFALGVLIGALVGRALPAIILTAVIASIGLTGGEQVHQQIMRGEAVAIPMDPETGSGGRPGDLYIDQQFVLPDGSLVGYDYFGGQDPFDEFGPKYPMVSIVVPGERYRFVETREALALAGGSLVALALAAFVVSRRRPG